ncbi:hypothetical protein ACOMHN_032583 [Nucella lapillus]
MSGAKTPSTASRVTWSSSTELFMGPAEHMRNIGGSCRNIPQASWGETGVSEMRNEQDSRAVERSLRADKTETSRIPVQGREVFVLTRQKPAGFPFRGDKSSCL